MPSFLLLFYLSLFLLLFAHFSFFEYHRRLVCEVERFRPAARRHITDDRILATEEREEKKKQSKFMGKKKYGDEAGERKALASLIFPKLRRTMDLFSF